MSWRRSSLLSSIKTKRQEVKTFPLFAKLSILLGTVMQEGHLLLTPLYTQYLTEKRKYLEAQLVNILIGKRFLQRFLQRSANNIFCDLFFFESGCSYFYVLFWRNLISTKSVFSANHESKKRYLFIGTKSNNKITYNQSLRIDFCEKYKIPKKKLQLFHSIVATTKLSYSCWVFWEFHSTQAGDWSGTFLLL